MDGTYTPPYQEPTYSYETQSVQLSDGSALYVSRYKDIVMLRMNLTTRSALSAWATIATIPAKYRPSEDIWFMNALSTSQTIGFSLGNTGALVPSTYIPSGTSIWATATYIAKNR